MNLEAIAGVGLLAFTVICSLVGGAYKLGQHSNRITSLEDRQDKADAKHDKASTDIGDLKTGMASLSAKFDGLRETMSEGFENVAALINGKTTARRTRAKQ